MKLYSIFELLNAYKENKHLIDAYYKNKSVEGYSNNTKNVGNFDPRDFPIDPNKAIDAGLSILGMGIGIFIMYLIFSVVILIWSCILISKLNLDIGEKIILYISSFVPGISYILFVILLCLKGSLPVVKGSTDRATLV